MSYIGNQPTQVAFLVDTFSGTGSTTTYTMSVAPASSASVIVAISGVLQDPSTYGVTGNTLTFSTAPPSGSNNISARYLGIPAAGVTTTAYRTLTTFTATSGQTTFSPPSYTVGFINVYRNGVLLTPASDYTASNGTTVVLATGATTGDTVLIESFLVSSVLNAIPATAGAVQSSYLASNLTFSGSTNMTGGSKYQVSGVTTNALAWVNFNGTLSGTITPRANYNVSSVTKNTTGDYTLNFTSNTTDANYAVCGTAGRSSGQTNLGAVCPTTFSTSSLRFGTNYVNGTGLDYENISVAVFGN